MHHPGPPRFVATGHEVELAPRDPDPEASYSWTLVTAPAESTATIGDQAVEHLIPDVAGRYLARLSAPDGDHELTIRAFPGELSPGVSYRSGPSGTVDGSETPGARPDDITTHRSGLGPAPDRPSRGDGGRPRLTLRPAIEGDEAVLRAETRPHPDGSAAAEDLRVEFLFDDRDAIDPAVARTSEATIRFPLSAIDDRVRVHAVAVGPDGYSVPDAVAFVNTVDDEPSYTATRLYDPPAWAEDACIYEIYVRTFGDPNDGPSAFDSIIERLDYIESLGVDTLWLTPVLENDHAPHGYNIRDFFSIAADLGTRTDYERLVEAAHERDIRVLFDLVCNHSARTHPYFEAAVSDPESPYRDWYEWRGDTEPETYFEWEHIANFNFDHLPVRRHLLDAIDEWAPLVDGFRVDMAWAVPNGFWRELHDRVKARDADFLLLDETIPYIPDFQGGLFDMHFDSTTYFALRQIGRGADAEELIEAIETRTTSGFPDHAGFMVYTENHDEERYVVECGRAATEAAIGALFTIPGAPMLYAGQEFGERSRRADLVWEHGDDALRDHVRALSTTRQAQPALATEAALERVSYEVIEGWEDRVVAYARVGDEQTVVVILNFGEEPARVTLDAVTASRDLVTGSDVGDGESIMVRDVVVLPLSA